MDLPSPGVVFPCLAECLVPGVEYKKAPVCLMLWLPRSKALNHPRYLQYRCLVDVVLEIQWDLDQGCKEDLGAVMRVPAVSLIPKSYRVLGLSDTTLQQREAVIQWLERHPLIQVPV